MSDIDIPARLDEVGERIARAAVESGRTADEVRLLLATKTVPADRIRIALAAGSTLIGENRVQEVVEKADDLSDVAHESHFIGNLQRNKINQVLPHVSCIQSVDRLKLAAALSARIDQSSPMDVFVQVNTSGEESKFGVDPSEAIGLAAAVDGLEGLTVRGFMTIGLFSSDEVAVRRCYELLRGIRDVCVQREGLDGAKELSMGMSGDLEWAIAEGSTLVRVGTAVFGARTTPDSFYWPEGRRRAN